MGLRDRAHLRLDAGQPVAGRPFTDPAATAEDCAILAVLQATLKRAAAGDRGPGAMSFTDEVGRHHVVVPDWTALAAARPAAMVGFFGQARDDVDRHRRGAGRTADPAHTAAVARTPQHYRSLRLHRGVLADGGLGATRAHVAETVYLDFGETPTWRALRVYA
jgi:hypothetical protein